MDRLLKTVNHPVIHRGSLPALLKEDRTINTTGCTLKMPQRMKLGSQCWM